jgi:hypothetical protein
LRQRKTAPVSIIACARRLCEIAYHLLKERRCYEEPFRCAYNNHARANAAANAIMLSQELGVRLKAMPPEAILQKFPDLVKEPKAFS